MKRILVLITALVSLTVPARAGQIADWSKVELTPAQQQCLTAFDKSDYDYSQCRVRNIVFAERVEEFKQLDAQFGCEAARANNVFIAPLTKTMCSIDLRVERIVAQELELIRKKYGYPAD
ncbi:MAG: hypothetical protein DI628_05440 [Blastochloris viridis]|uniref:DUF1311 domain-containing protein n=1 Tax=Blastochloris viridis TaxID=1079 RepID=A0A6N4RDK2_BLAVI|nr:MAG: hypothetical protein DI628_05440 [Blastochloris viridis]